MTELQKMIERIGGDYDKIMPRFVNSEAFFWKCFEIYLKDDNLKKLGEALTKNDYDAAFLCAHTLKGVVGNMGFEMMYRQVCEIVEALRAKDAARDYGLMYERIVRESERIKKAKEEVDAL